MPSETDLSINSLEFVGEGLFLKNSKQLNYVIVRFVWSFLGKEVKQKMSIVFAGFLLCAGYNMYISSFNFHKALWHTYNHYEHRHPYVIDIDTLRLNNMTLVTQ